MKYVKIKKSVVQSSNKDYVHIIKDGNSYYCTFNVHKEPNLGWQVVFRKNVDLEEAEEWVKKEWENDKNTEVLRFIKKGKHPNVKWIEVDKEWKRK